MICATKLQAVLALVCGTLFLFTASASIALTPQKKTASSGCHYQFFFQDKDVASWTLTRPSSVGDTIDLCVPAAFTGAYGGVVGVHAIDGKFQKKDAPDTTIGGEVCIEHGLCKIIRAAGGRVDASVAASIEKNRGCLFQVFDVVLDGHAEHFRDKTKFQRRGLAKFRDGTVAVVETAEAITLTQFGTDMQEFEAQEVANLDMGAWDEGWYRNDAGKVIVLGTDKSNTSKQTNWLVFAKTGARSSAPSPASSLGPKISDRAVQAFIPAGWVIEHRVDGNLTGTSSPDCVLQLKEKSSSAGGDEARERMLIVLQAQHDGKYKVIASATKILLCTTCGGVLADPDGGNIKVSIRDNEVVVSQTKGDVEAVEITDKFKWNPQLKSFMQTEEIFDHDNRATGGSEVTISDFRAATKSVTNYQMVESTGKKRRLRSKSEKLKEKAQKMESFDISQY